jgi:hypothetical protein
MPQRNKLILGFLALFLLFCCGLFSLAALLGDTETTAPRPQVSAAAEEAAAALPTSTRAPLPTAAPTLTAAPTDTPTATSTSSPTNTPAPTNTPTTTPSPTATPTPFIIEGVGDAVVDVDRNDSPSLIHITGNAASRHFAVKGYGGGRPTLLVNSTDPYQGTVRLDADTIALEITAVGAWTIDITGR